MAFKRDKQMGDTGEALAYEWLAARELVACVEDVSKDPHYQKKDIDFIVNLTTGNQLKVDVKYDTRIDQTGHVFIELISNNTRWSPGNFLYSEADLFLYIFAKSEQVLILPLKETRDYVYSRCEGYKIGRCPNYGYGGKLLYSSLGRLVRYKELLENIESTALVPLH